MVQFIKGANVFEWITQENQQRFKMLINDIECLKVQVPMQYRKNNIQGLKDAINRIYGRGLDTSSFGYQVTTPRVLAYLDEVYQKAIYESYFYKCDYAVSVQCIEQLTNIDGGYIRTLLKAMIREELIDLHSIGTCYAQNPNGRKGVKFYSCASYTGFDNIYDSVEYLTIKPIKPTVS